MPAIRAGSAVDELYRAITATGRPVEILCVDASIDGGVFVDTGLKIEPRMIDLNIRGAVQLTKLVHKVMVVRDAGRPCR